MSNQPKNRELDRQPFDTHFRVISAGATLLQIATWSGLRSDVVPRCGDKARHNLVVEAVQQQKATNNCVTNDFVAGHLLL